MKDYDMIYNGDERTWSIGRVAKPSVWHAIKDTVLFLLFVCGGLALVGAVLKLINPSFSF